jgi:lysyl-tRNA synthetase class 2
MSAAFSKLQRLQDRALFLQKARSFFYDRGILEVDTPILSKTAPIDEHIDIMKVIPNDGETGYLHSSPEYAMKRLLCEGIQDIFQLGHVFRQGEHGALHNPEFTMVEWYRIGMDFLPFIEETIEFIRLFLGPLGCDFLTYREAFFRATQIDPMKATVEDLLEVVVAHGFDLSVNIEKEKDILLHLLMGFVVEPHLGKDKLTVVMDYPASQAALAAVEEKQGEYVAKRFEVYYQGIELGNGYLELTDADQQEQRLRQANEKRMEKGRESLPLDCHFIAALQKGMPPCCGVAVGFDRLLQLHCKATRLQEILPFGWEDL